MYAASCPYDGDGLLRKQDDCNDVRQFVWQDDHLAGEYDGSGNLLRRYDRDPGGYGPLTAVEEANGDRRYPSFDSAGNVRRVYDEQDNLIEESLVSAFGQLKDQSGSSTNPSQSFLAELGGWRDAATGLIYLRQRWYDPVTGRFLSPDPLGEQADSNPYRYAGNNPVTRQDPSGLDYIDVTGTNVAVWVSGPPPPLMRFVPL